jgi:hypothetical protein
MEERFITLLESKEARSRFWFFFRRFVFREAARQDNPINAEKQQCNAKNKGKSEPFQVSRSQDCENDSRHTQKKPEAVPRGPRLLENGTAPFHDGTVPFHHAFHSIHVPDVLIHELDDRRNGRLATAATGQTFAEVNRAFRAKAFAARLATADGLPVLMIKTTHRNWVSSSVSGAMQS